MKGLPMIRAAFQILLAAVLAVPGLATAATVEYIHTDALGSPMAVTNSAGQVIERREYEPYGRQLAPTTLTNGPGYTGHVTDAATGLSYMQQRYYDPVIGRFLSVDPVAANATNGANFNRYLYAASNPYRFVDPDGRQERAAEQFSDSFASMSDGEREGLARTLGGGLEGAGALWLEVNSGGPSKAGAGGVVSKGALQELGVVYKRINPRTLEEYIGQAKNWVRYLARQAEHNRNIGVQHIYKVLDRAERGKALRYSEEMHIRAAGGIKKEGGPLANRIHAMSQKNVEGFQGVFRVQGRLDARELEKKLSK